jgi:hypothetical protein
LFKGSRFKREYAVGSGSGQRGFKVQKGVFGRQEDDFAIMFVLVLHTATVNCGLEDQNKSIDSLSIKEYL